MRQLNIHHQMIPMKSSMARSGISLAMFEDGGCNIYQNGIPNDQHARVVGKARVDMNQAGKMSLFLAMGQNMSKRFGLSYSKIMDIRHHPNHR